MKRFMILGVVAILVLLLAPVTAFSNPAGPPGGMEVKIVNQPVEVTGAVDATVSGNVKVTNDSSNPVPVTGTVNLEVKTIEPAYANWTVLNAGSPSCHHLYTVPQDKFLIIEDVSGRLCLSSDCHAITSMSGCHLTIAVSGAECSQANQKAIIVAGNELPIQGGRPALLYANPGDEVAFNVEGCEEEVHATVMFNGRLISVP